MNVAFSDRVASPREFAIVNLRVTNRHHETNDIKEPFVRAEPSSLPDYSFSNLLF